MINRRRSLSLLGASAVALSAGARAGAADMPKRETADATDPLFTEPYVDTDEWRDDPVRHRYVHGGFKGTDTRFSFYFAPKEQYEGRFFQPIAPVPGDENGAQKLHNFSNPAVTQEISTIAFAIASGGYLVESNMGRTTMYPGDDHTITGYRASAASAQYSRLLAAEMYGHHRPYGYAFGASGGSLKTISCIENTNGVWDGVVPYVTACDMSLPSDLSVSAHAMRILKDKFPAIVDAVDPGGSGDIYAGLNEEERAALTEATRFGFPPATWFAYKRVALAYTGVIASLLDQMVRWDPQYFDDFWKVPGYLGANPPESLRRARIQHRATITRVIMSDEADKMGLPLTISTRQVAALPAAIQLSSVPTGELQGANVIFTKGPAAGRRVSIVGVTKDIVLIGIGEDAMAIASSIKAGDEVQVDNSIYLAAQTYHRHQVPPSRDYCGWDQFRGPDGKPIYPQRPVLLGPKYQEYGAGSIQNGRFNGKMIIVQSLMDEGAYAWHGDWYRSKVQKVLGPGPRLDDNFRLWFTEHAMHGRPQHQEEEARIVSYLGVLQQALRDVAAWAEKGVPPPASTTYKLVDGQVQVPATAAERKGIQPVVTVSADGGVRAETTVGKPVTLTGVIEVPPGTGKVVIAEWDFEGTGHYSPAGKLRSEPSGVRATVTATHTFSKPGTYFPVLRAAGQRQGDAETPFAKPQNLGRARVVVS